MQPSRWKEEDLEGGIPRRLREEGLGHPHPVPRGRGEDHPAIETHVLEEARRVRASPSSLGQDNRGREPLRLTQWEGPVPPTVLDLSSGLWAQGG